MLEITNPGKFKRHKKAAVVTLLVGLTMLFGLLAEANHLGTAFWIGRDTYHYTRATDRVTVEEKMDVQPFVEPRPHLCIRTLLGICPGRDG